MQQVAAQQWQSAGTDMDRKAAFLPAMLRTTSFAVAMLWAASIVQRCSGTH